MEKELNKYIECSGAEPTALDEVGWKVKENKVSGEKRISAGQ